MGPAARSQGFKGSPPNWRRTSDEGDWAVVNVQLSQFGSTADSRCVINLGFAPEPWLRWWREQTGRNMPKTVSAASGLYRERLHPSGTPTGIDGWWNVPDSDAAAQAAAADMVSQMDRSGWPVLLELFDRDTLLERVRARDFGMNRSTVYWARAAALLLMDGGPSESLEEELANAVNGLPAEQREDALRFDAWVREQSLRT
jgi:hypothetical protein